jgi:hypothetical protein
VILVAMMSVTLAWMDLAREEQQFDKARYKFSFTSKSFESIVIHSVHFLEQLHTAFLQNNVKVA